MRVASVGGEVDPRQDVAPALGTEELGGGEVVAVAEQPDVQVGRPTSGPPVGDQRRGAVPEIAPVDAPQREGGPDAWSRRPGDGLSGTS